MTFEHKVIIYTVNNKPQTTALIPCCCLRVDNRNNDVTCTHLTSLNEANYCACWPAFILNTGWKIPDLLIQEFRAQNVNKWDLVANSHACMTRPLSHPMRCMESAHSYSKSWNKCAQHTAPIDQAPIIIVCILSHGMSLYDSQLVRKVSNHSYMHATP